jgi:hypothetical protein
MRLVYTRRQQLDNTSTAMMQVKSVLKRKSLAGSLSLSRAEDASSMSVSGTPQGYAGMSAVSKPVGDHSQQHKDDAMFSHLEWRGPEFYLNSMKLLLSSSIASLSFGASLFSPSMGPVNALVGLTLAPSMLAMALTPTMLFMYSWASAASRTMAQQVIAEAVERRRLAMEAKGARAGLARLLESFDTVGPCA